MNAGSAGSAGNTTRRIPVNVRALGFVSLLTDAASEMIYPLVPIFVAALGSGAIVLGVIEGVAETTASMLKLISGLLSDKLKKRKLLVVIGYTISSLVRPLTGLVGAAWQIVLVRMADRVGKGIRTAPRDALIASSAEEQIRGRAYGFHRAMDHAGAVIGPLLAVCTLFILVFLCNITDTTRILRAAFLLAIVPGVGAIAIVALFVRESVDINTIGKPFTFSLRRFDRNFIIYLFVVTFFTLGNSSDAFLLFRANEALHTSGALYRWMYGAPVFSALLTHFGDTEAQKRLVDILFLPLVWAYFHVIKVIFSTPLGALSDRIGRKKVITIGWAIYTFVYVCFALLDRLPGNWQIAATLALFGVYALFYAFTEGAEKAFVADLSAGELRGSAFGMYNFAVGLGALPASVIFGLVYGAFGGGAAFGMGAAVACVSMLLLWTMVRGRGG